VVVVVVSCGSVEQGLAVSDKVIGEMAEKLFYKEQKVTVGGPATYRV